MGLKYGGKLVDDYSAMQGPCTDGYHVPTKDEWVTLCGILTTTFSMANNATTMGTYLKMPKAGYRDYSSSTTGQKDGHGRYWSSMPSATVNNAYYLFFSSATINPQNYDRYAYGYSVRGFKDIPAIPDSNWTILYQGTGSAGVFRNSSLGLISVSGDGTTWYTIQDKNLGATTVYNQGDTLSEDNCGTYFQRGNNYGFVWTGSVTTSSTQVDASDYGPNTENGYYSSDTFIIGNTNWSSVRNNDLRGGVTGIQQKPAPIVKRYYGGKLVDDYSAMQGPCDIGYHVPTKDEWQSVITAGVTIGAFDDSTQGWSNRTTFCTYLHLPGRYFRSRLTGDIYDNTEKRSCQYWTSSFYSTTKYGRRMLVTIYKIQLQNEGPTTFGLYLRAFKDTPVTPDSSWTTVYDGSSTATGAGIFYNATLGLISISSDGTNWITIKDKNEGATTVYNYGDEVTADNAGGFFQQGNNYMFPFSGSVTTSGTQIDASTYGPGNYYSSSTFIALDNRWDSSKNNNLRGGVTGVQQRPALIVKTYYGGKLVDDYSAIKGPCPDGFHIPTTSEINTLYSYMNTLGLTDTGLNFKEKLLLPNSARLKQQTGTRENVNYSYLLTCNSAANGSAGGIRIAQTSIYTGNNGTLSKSGGHSIRPFRDTPVTPDSSWTTIYDGSSVSTGAGVFHNSTLGLISLSGDGTNRLTIADKNLGATQVWNPGDTLTSDNAGKYYQRGNNYGFDMTGATTTSSTKVDASTYGPGNYYSSSTFITDDSSSIKAWDTTINTNLRGGTTGIQQRPAEIRSAY